MRVWVVATGATFLPVVAFAADDGASAPSPSASASASNGAPSATTSAATSAAAPSPAASSSASAEPEVEIVDLSETPQTDRQGLAAGVIIGLGGASTIGSAGVTPLLQIGLAIDVGLGRAMARVPWTLESWFSFSVTADELAGSAQVSQWPDRFTELGARVRYTFPGGPLAGRWLSLGGGVAFTSYGYAGLANNETAGLVDLGIGVQEWASRRARVGLALHVPVAVADHPGFGVFGAFYASIGTGL